MLFSHTCQVALKSISYIASNEGRCVTVKELSESISENSHTIAKVLQLLAKATLISSLTGPMGGFYLTPEQKTQPLLNFVKIVQGNDAFEQCVLGLKRCSHSRPCPMHQKFEKARKDISLLFETITPKQLGPALQKGNVFLI